MISSVMESTDMVSVSFRKNNDVYLVVFNLIHQFIGEMWALDFRIEQHGPIPFVVLVTIGTYGPYNMVLIHFI